MYHVSAEGVDERVINVHYYLLLLFCFFWSFLSSSSSSSHFFFFFFLLLVIIVLLYLQLLLFRLFQVLDVSFRISYLVLMFIPIITALFLYSKIFHVAKQQIESIAKTQGLKSVIPRGRYMKMIFIMAGLYILFYVPPGILHLLFPLFRNPLWSVLAQLDLTHVLNTDSACTHAHARSHARTHARTHAHYTIITMCF